MVPPAVPICAPCAPRRRASQEYSAVYVASQRLDQLLELMANDGDTRPMVVTSRDRLDIVMGLLASQVGTGGCLPRGFEGRAPQPVAALLR